jgi:hypothetical protein
LAINLGFSCFLLFLYFILFPDDNCRSYKKWNYRKALTISNKDYLAALFQLVKNSSSDKEVVKLTEEQMVMLNLRENDIKDGKLIQGSKLDKPDLKWLKEL